MTGVTEKPLRETATRSQGFAEESSIDTPGQSEAKTTPLKDAKTFRKRCRPGLVADELKPPQGDRDGIPVTTRS